MNPARQAPRSAPRAPNAPWRVAVACHIPIRLEGRTRTLSGPYPDLSQARTLAPSSRREDLLIRRNRHTVQNWPLRSVRWADTPQLSIWDRRCPAAWQQYWQQWRPNGTDPRPSAFQAGQPCRCTIVIRSPCRASGESAGVWMRVPNGYNGLSFPDCYEVRTDDGHLIRASYV
jgi:hypothetical protein